MIILGFVLSESLSLGISEALRDQPDVARWALVMSPTRTVMALVGGLFEEPELSEGVPVNAALGVMAGVIAICCVIMFAWYQRRD